MKIFIIGNGNVAYSLIPAIQHAGHQILGVYGRNKDYLAMTFRSYGVATYCDLEKIPLEADLYIICTADNAIETVATLLPKNLDVVHTSGSTDINVLSQRFDNCGVMYPVQTFSKGITVDFGNVPLLIEGSNEIVATKIKTLAETISHNVRNATSQQRKYLHLSAVFACNFVNHAIAVSKVLMEENNLDYEILKPLVMETIRKAMTSDTILSQTGPAVREDFKTLEKQAAMLECRSKIKQKQMYLAISESIINYKHIFKNGISTQNKTN